MTPLTEQENGAAAALIARYPLAWVISRNFNASVLPLLAERNANGAITTLLGHCGRRNPLVVDFRSDASGLILFTGPQAFIGTGLVSNRDWAPTWNFAVLRFAVDIEFVPDETEALVERLLDHMEGPKPGRWQTTELGARKGDLLAWIIGLRAHVRELRPHFKLGQDERRETFAEIVERVGDPALAAWMTAFARGETP